MHLATSLRRPLLALVLLAASAVPAIASTVNPGDLLVTSDAANVCRNYSGTSGAFQSIFTPSIGAFGQMAVHIHPTNGRVLIGSSNGGVEEFDANGAYIKTYNPGGGWQWAGIYAPNGQVYIGDMSTNDVRRYHPTTGAFLGFLAPVPSPSDMEFGPNGNLYVCSFNAGVVFEIDPSNGNVLNSIVLPGTGQANDVTWNPANGEMLITSTAFPGLAHRYSYPGYVHLGTFAGTNWTFPHGITISPHTGRILAIDGTTAQVHEFNQTTYVETNAAFLTPAPGLKIVDLAFAPGNPTPGVKTTWGRLKSLYRK